MMKKMADFDKLVQMLISVLLTAETDLFAALEIVWAGGEVE